MLASKIGRFLRILCGCHARPDRSFFFKGKQFPICARCTGELAGIIFGIPIVIIFGIPKIYITVIIMMPMIFDGFLQLLTPYESGNIRRLFTGILFGIALVILLIYFHRSCVWIAGEIWKIFVDNPQNIDRAVESLT